MKLKNFKKLFKKREIHKSGHLIFSLAILLIILFTFSNPTRVSVQKAIFILALGVIVGLIDVPKKEANSFIIASIGILVASMAQYEQITYTILGLQYTIGQYIKGFLLNTTVFLGPAMIIVALKIIYRVYRE